jgi:polysaccharide biosynthesis transport protein
MSFSLLLTILRARWLLALSVLALALALAVAGSLLWPKSYKATASVLVDVQAPNPVTGIYTSTLVASGYMATQVDLIQSERVLRKAIASLGLAQDETLRQEWLQDSRGVGDFQAWMAKALLRDLDVKPTRDSNVLSISYSSRNPAFSAAVTNAIIKGYLDTSIELRTEPARRINAFFEERSKKLRDDLEVAQNRLTAYQRANGITANDERIDVENLRLSEISSQMVMMEAIATEAASRRGQAGATPDRMQEVLNNPVVSGLQADVSRQEARLQELGARLGDANPQVIEARQAVSGLREKLQLAIDRASGSVSVTNNVAQQRLAQLRIARDEQRTKVLKLKSARDELVLLQRDVDSAQRAYDSVMIRASQSGLESQVTQTNISVVRDATAPAAPSSPILLLNLVIGLTLGLIAGVTAALVREMFDQRLRKPDDVTQALRLPLLVVMPKTTKSKSAADKTSFQVRQRIDDRMRPVGAVR